MARFTILLLVAIHCMSCLGTKDQCGLKCSSVIRKRPCWQQCFDNPSSEEEPAYKLIYRMVNAATATLASYPHKGKAGMAILIESRPYEHLSSANEIPQRAVASLQRQLASILSFAASSNSDKRPTPIVKYNNEEAFTLEDWQCQEDTCKQFSMLNDFTIKQSANELRVLFSARNFQGLQLVKDIASSDSPFHCLRNASIGTIVIMSSRYSQYLRTEDVKDVFTKKVLISISSRNFDQYGDFDHNIRFSRSHAELKAAYKLNDCMHQKCCSNLETIHKWDKRGTSEDTKHKFAYSFNNEPTEYGKLPFSLVKHVLM